jgi:hypothetical protein
LRIPGIQGIAGAGEIAVVALILLHEPVVGGVVGAPQADGRPQVAPLAGVVVHDVDDDLEPGFVQCLDHVFELRDLGPACAR